MLDFLERLWSILNKQQSSGLNLTSIFSYEIISNFYFEICCLYSNLFYNPTLLAKNCSSQTKILLDMVEKFTFTYTAVNVMDDSSQLIVVRLKFLNNILQNENLFDICVKNMINFEHKIICFIIFAYLNSTNSSTVYSNNKEPNEARNSANNHVERELQSLVKFSIEKIKVFTDLALAFNSNLEEFLTSFVKRISTKIKNIQVI